MSITRDRERIALAAQAPFCWPETPPEVARLLVNALRDRGDGLAAGVLAAIGRLAPEPLAGLAVTEATRLAGRGIASPHAEAAGSLEVVEAERLDVGDGAAEIWFAVLSREGETLVQPLVVFVEHEPCGAVIVDASLAEPMPRGDAAGVLDQLDGAPRRLSAGELSHALREALDHMVRHDLPLGLDASLVLPLLERALTGHAGRLPRPLPAEADAEQAGRREAELLVEAFEHQLERTGVSPDLLEHGPFVAHTMLEWKLDYGDGELLQWGLADLREFMLEWFPRKVTCEPETPSVVPAAVVAFLGFLEVAELLEVPVPITSLTAAVKRLTPRFVDACGDPRRWGPAKALAYQMRDEGVDLTDPDAMGDWLEAYNSRPFEEREPARRAPAQKRGRRKAARQARKRNRR
ncbi:MAG TPA: hypothetical protein VFG79_23305 [Solirubrobacter sp.]|nr:hypothetical protein [Solirubrobacter sp.]